MSRSLISTSHDGFFPCVTQCVVNTHAGRRVLPRRATKEIYMEIRKRRLRPLGAFTVGLGLAASLLQVAAAQPTLLVDSGGASGSGRPLFSPGGPTCSPPPAGADTIHVL